MQSSNEGIVFVAHLGFYGSGYPYPWRESMGLLYMYLLWMAENFMGFRGFHVVVNIPNPWRSVVGYLAPYFWGLRVSWKGRLIQP